MEIPKGSTLYFDTNIFEGVNDNKCSKLQELAATKNVKCCCPPRVFIELPCFCPMKWGYYCR